MAQYLSALDVTDDASPKELVKAGASAPHVFICPALAGRNKQLTPSKPWLTRLAC
jgi:hypothetical protein